MATEGWTSFTSVNRREIVIAPLNQAEWNDDENGPITALNRVSRSLGRSDLRLVNIAAVEHSSQSARLSFREFRQSRHAPRILYTGLNSNEPAEQESEQSLPDFLSNGGVLTIANA